MEDPVSSFPRTYSPLPSRLNKAGLNSFMLFNWRSNQRRKNKATTP